MREMPRHTHKGRICILVLVALAAFVLCRGTWHPKIWARYYSDWAASGRMAYFGKVVDDQGRGIPNAVVVLNLTKQNPLYFVGKQSSIRDVEIHAKTDAAGLFHCDLHGMHLSLKRVSVGNLSAGLSEYPSVSAGDHAWRRDNMGELVPGTDPKNPVIIEFYHEYELEHWDDFRVPAK